MASQQQLSSPWFDDKVVDRLRELWVDHSSGAIAGILWDEFRVRVTRNSVIGKLHRLGLTVDNKEEVHPLTRIDLGGGKTPRVRTRTRSTAFREPTLTREEVTLRCVEIEPRNLTLLDLEPDDCRFAVNEGDPQFLFCARPKMKGSSYCPGHFFLTRQEPKKRDGLRAKMPIDLSGGRCLRFAGMPA